MVQKMRGKPNHPMSRTRSSARVGYLYRSVGERKIVEKTGLFR